ncbi:hypothetical protein THRCLA_22502 [Thraustotheca clavata]|uniref:Transmembrane protein n=1 Tax=Thraustotheca clavata TaxID=74557 RepID=A0A1V9YYU7_9STRA|nr:hypothetical protein THRCLA_22502 [Thraustotheca clavata]
MAGNFSWDIDINGYLWIMAVPAVINVPVVWCNISLYWAKVENLNSALMTILADFVSALVIYAAGRYGTNWNWKYVLAIAAISITIIASIAYSRQCLRAVLVDGTGCPPETSQLYLLGIFVPAAFGIFAIGALKIFWRKIN